MKILIAVPDTGVGGVTTAAVNLSNELVARGHEICFLDKSGAFECAERFNEGVNLLYLKGRSKLWNIGNDSVRQVCGIKKLGILALGAIKKLTIRSGLWYKLIFSKFNKNESFDVAIAFRQCAPCYSFVLDKVRAKKKLGFVHGDVDFMGDISSWQPLMKRFDKVAYVSNAVKDGFVKKYPELKNNAYTIYNMLDVDNIKKRAEEQSAVVFNNDKFNIITVSRISNAEKRIDWIPQICQNLLNNGISDFHWYVVGYGDDLEKDLELTKKLGMSEYVTFVHKTDNPFSVLKNSDLFVLPTRSESYGLAVVEALILHIPVVVCKYPAISEIFENGEHGLIAEQSIESVTEKIKYLIENRKEYDRIKKKCENNEFTNDVAYEQFINSVS